MVTYNELAIARWRDWSDLPIKLIMLHNKFYVTLIVVYCVISNFKILKFDVANGGLDNCAAATANILATCPAGYG